jgi:hypothetical protein
LENGELEDQEKMRGYINIVLMETGFKNGKGSGLRILCRGGLQYYGCCTLGCTDVTLT